jgi:hypothetical protein
MNTGLNNNWASIFSLNWKSNLLSGTTRFQPIHLYFIPLNVRTYFEQISTTDALGEKSFHFSRETNFYWKACWFDTTASNTKNQLWCQPTMMCNQSHAVFVRTNHLGLVYSHSLESCNPETGETLDQTCKINEDNDILESLEVKLFYTKWKERCVH